MTAQPSLLRTLIQPLVAADVVDFWAGELRSLWTWQRPLARVVERRVEARNTVTLVLKPNRHFEGFRPGQHVNVGVEVQGMRLTRSYSFSDIPRRDGLLAITVKQVEGGRVSTQLCQRTRVGDVLELSPAFGELALADGPALLLAAGSGITPLMSLIRQAVAVGLKHDLTLVYWAKTRADYCFYEELKTLAAREPRFRVQWALTAETGLVAGERQGRPDAVLLADLVPDLAQRQVLACGGAGFVDTVRQLTAGQASSFQAEAFTPPTAVPVALTGTVRVELAASGRVLELSAGQSLLAALEAQGVRPAYGCRMGICNTCACGKLAGATDNLLTGEVSTDPQSALKLCVSRARTDLILDL